MRKLQRRVAEEEIEKLEALFKDVQLPQKIRTQFVKQLEIIRKCVGPKKPGKDASQNKSSGFLKPFKISAEMREFAGWKEEELHSRVDVAKAICEYVKKNNLQKPENRKIILPDEKLDKLLKWNVESDRIFVSILSVDEENRNVKIKIEKCPGMKKKLGYYNNSELRDPDTKKELDVINSITKCEESEDVYIFNLKNGDVKLEKDKIYELSIPLTYPKFQTKINVHILTTSA